VIARAIERFGRLGILVNNAACQGEILSPTGRTSSH